MDNARPIAAILDGGAGLLVAAEQIGAVSREVANLGQGAQSRFDPARGGAHAHAQAVVFADEQQRQGLVLVRDPTGGIECAERAAVVDASIAKTAQNQGVRGLLRQTLRALPAERVGQADGAG